jgi:hypothetical protein
LQDALDIFFQDESIEDFKCEKCGNNKEDIVIHRKFFRLPRILILHLKRYNHMIKRDEKSTNEKNKDSNLGTSTSSVTSLEAKSNETVTSTVTKKNASFINIPRYLTLQFLVIDKTLLKLPKKIPNSISMTTPCKELPPKNGLEEKLSIQPKIPLKDNSINIDYKNYSQEINDVLSPLAGHRLQTGKNTNSTPRIPLSSTTLNQQKSNTKNNSLISNITSENSHIPRNSQTSFSRITKSKSSEYKKDSTKIQNSASQEPLLIDTNSNENNFIPLLEFEQFDRSNYIIKDITEDEQINIALQISLTEPIQNQTKIFGLSQERLRRRTPSPLPQLDGNNDESSDPDIVEVKNVSNEERDSRKILNDENSINNSMNKASMLYFIILTI